MSEELMQLMGLIVMANQIDDPKQAREHYRHAIDIAAGVIQRCSSKIESCNIKIENQERR